ncbi:hypothetical protein DM01DRAFT_1337793 [Hesseltinella vesiculosa]|uniref:Uncharacterized protein n=1 Tax=Hesseltinella vesiculosa TaxID=101127 RepID=A0A1X2GBP2_9FUNG|nr:hypothetical protein DM01DRAFT_1337793 [Hesseltinella vesiculosa]
MGNRLSTSTFGSSSSLSSSTRSNDKNTIPKHLRPGKASKKEKQQFRDQIQLQQQFSEQMPHPDEIGVAIPHPPTDSPTPAFLFDPNKNDFVLDHQAPSPLPARTSSVVPPPPSTRQRKPSLFSPMTSIQQLYAQQLPNDAGPKDAYAWFQGRRFTNQTGMLLPVDQPELDRLRVLNYILRWAFQGDILAPVKPELAQGTNVLNLACGPGIWLGHLVIDYALDYPASQFVAVDVADLLPQRDLITLLQEPSDQPTPVPQTFVHPPDGQSPPSLLQQPSSLSSYRRFSPLHPHLHQHSPSTHAINAQKLAPPSSAHSLHSSSVSSVASHASYPQATSSITTQSSMASMISSTSSSSASTSPPFTTRSLFDNLDLYCLDVRLQPLPFPDNHFTFVMERLSATVFTRQHWDHVISEMIRVTAPGGYIQFIEVDYSSHNLGPAGQAWNDKVREVMTKAKNLDINMASHLDEELRARGMCQVTKKQISLPFGAWGLDIGMLWQQNLEAFSVTSAPAIAMALGATPQQCLRMWERFRAELDHVKAFTNVYAVWAQKPL